MGTTAHTRVGLHLRAILGVGYLRIFDSSETSMGDQADVTIDNSTVSAMPIDMELWIGGALQRDLALNLVLRAGRANRGALHSRFQTVDLEGGLTTVFVGPGLIYYLHPARGWWLGAAAGFERWQASFERDAPPQVGGSGVAATLYAGHDWWMGPSTSFGLLARANLGLATGDGHAEVGQLQLENSDLDLYLQAGIAASLSFF